MALKKGPKIELSSELDFMKLEDILTQYKVGKKNVSQTMGDILQLHEHTMRCHVLKQVDTQLQLSDNHMTACLMAFNDQHQDFQDLIKVVKDVLKKK